MSNAQFHYCRCLKCGDKFDYDVKGYTCKCGGTIYPESVYNSWHNSNPPTVLALAKFGEIDASQPRNKIV